MQRNVQGDAGGVVVLMPRRAGDDPGQADGVKEGDGAVNPSRLPEGVLQRGKQQPGIFVGIRFPGQNHAADISPDVPLWDAVSGAAARKAENGVVFFQNKGVFR